MRIHLIIFFTLFSLLVEAQQVKNVDFKTGDAIVSIDPEKKSVDGALRYTFEVLQKVDSVAIDARKMNFTDVKLNNKKVKHKVTDTHLIIYKKFKKGQKHALSFSYTAQPKKAMYFIGWGTSGRKQVWTQGQGKYTSHWLPSFDDMNEKVIFDLWIAFNSAYEVIANGILKSKTNNGNGQTLWVYDMKEPMSSYLLAIAIGKYAKKEEQSKSGKLLSLYYYAEEEEKAEPTYRYSKQMFDFLEAEIGVPYPWQNYKQIPVKDFLYAGMENTGTTIFSDNLLTDDTGFVDHNYVNVNAHELAHQWFGDLVTETHGTHHWLQEGFATYYALLAEKDIFGDDYYYYELYKTSEQLIKAQETDTIPLMNPKASSLTFYQKGAWVLHVLREKVGDEAFKNAIQKYLKKYQFKNVSTNDFIGTVEQESGMDLTAFLQLWLKDNKFPAEVAKASLSKNKSIALLYKIKESKDYSLLFESSKPAVNSYYYPVFEELVYDVVQKREEEKSQLVLKQLFQSGSIKIRQAIAHSLQQIPVALKQDYESLLNDASYRTIEGALFNLWVNFQTLDDRKRYLDTTKNITGLRDKNVRILWLGLALATEGYEDYKKRDYYLELLDYTSPTYGFEVRENAFAFLYQLRLFNELAINNLLDATKHHNWRFKKSSKELLEVLKKDEQLKMVFDKLEE